MNTKTSIVDFLKVNEIDSSFYNRTRIAILLGLEHYSGKGQENEHILHLLKSPTFENLPNILRCLN
jgi:hypothetical protein